ncbi:MAG: phosphoenolpyruvate synthase [Clostridia bacterium]|nr:phosphoenolpyruvate synthase [Clostridia bacterium]
MAYIIPFHEIRRTDIPSAGGKGANLGEMVSAGIPVPSGAVLCAAAYDLFIRENQIDPADILKRSASEKAASEEIRSRILKGHLPDAVAAEVRAFYRSLGDASRVAVRSSATAEDLEDASFAGQQETYLNVVSLDMLLEKIRACYASLWGTRAIHYRSASGYGERPVSLAVVIQQMIESESAGVLFTRNPADGTDHITINAAYGLGEAVVSGIVSPDEYICTRDGTAVKTIIGSKASKIVYAETGTVTVPVSSNDRERPVLDDRSLRQLVNLGIRIEQHYGHPMDIEWAIRDGQVYILQARQITTLTDAHNSRFTDQDFASLPPVRPADGRMRENVLFNLEKLPKPYFPLDHDFGDTVGQQKQRLIGEAGILMNEMTPIDDDGISSFAFGGMRPTLKIYRIPHLLRQLCDDSFNIQMSTDELNACQAAYEAECHTQPATVQALGESLARMRALISRTAYARFRYAIFPQVLENIGLNRTLAKLGQGLNSFDLLEGLSYVTADINRWMTGLADSIRKDPVQLQDVMTLPYAEILSRHPALKAQLDAFMEAYGNRSDFNCYCFVSKSWNDDPDRFLHSLRTILRGAPAAVPDLQEGQRRFSELMDRARHAIGSRRYARFERKVLAVRHYHTIREATQYLWESEFALCRKRLRDLSAMLSISYDDLLYLFADELLSVCKSGAVDDTVSARIERRKAKRPLAEAYWSRSISIMLDTGSPDITGVCGSCGKVTGKACIVRTPDEFSKLSQGDILVCPYTDPEWTPLFTLAAGVVVDTGGTLSHAAIVAREYQIPAVLATGVATQKIHDGDTVLVDADAGKVMIM